MTVRDDVLARFRSEGFPLVRVAPADAAAAPRAAALAAQSAGALDGMAWITPAWLERATDPSAFLPGARSVILVALAYRHIAPPQDDGAAARGRIAAYAGGRDYHRVFEKRLRRLARGLRDDYGAAARATVDYGPLLERPLARSAGLGWQGKSTMLLAPGFGPWLLLGAVATNLPLEPDPPLRKSCGACRRCIDVCPTGALSGDGGLVDSRRCISFHTIENRGPIPRDLRGQFGAWIFGCDLCLEVCPPGWRAFASEPELGPRGGEAAAPELTPLLALDDGQFAERYRGRPVLRAKRDGFLRNVCIALGNVGRNEDLPALLGALDDPSALVRGHAAWAAARLAARACDKQLTELVLAALRHAYADPDPFVRDEARLALDELAGR